MNASVMPSKGLVPTLTAPSQPTAPASTVQQICCLYRERHPNSDLSNMQILKETVIESKHNYPELAPGISVQKRGGRGIQLEFSYYNLHESDSEDEYKDGVEEIALNEERFQLLNKLLKNHAPIVSLKISSQNLKEHDLNQLGDALSGHPFISVLDFTLTSLFTKNKEEIIPDEKLKGLFSGIQKMPRLKVLNLDCTRLGDFPERDAAIIVNLLENALSIQSLYLRCNSLRISEKSYNALIKILETAEKSKTLKRIYCTTSGTRDPELENLKSRFSKLR